MVINTRLQRARQLPSTHFQIIIFQWLNFVWRPKFSSFYNEIFLQYRKFYLMGQIFGLFEELFPSAFNKEMTLNAQLKI